jgi:DNA-binding MarR family transcriptional regulator
MGWPWARLAEGGAPLEDSGAMKTNDAPSRWAPEATPSYWINRVSRALTRHFDARLAPFGFAMAQFPVLGALARGASRSQKELVRLARVEQPTMAAMLARMERDGIIERRPNPDDGRGALVRLTARAGAQLPEAMAALLAGHDEAMAGLSAVETRTLVDLLRRIAANLEERDDDPPSRR